MKYDLDNNLKLYIFIYSKKECKNLYDVFIKLYPKKKIKAYYADSDFNNELIEKDKKGNCK